MCVFANYHVQRVTILVKINIYINIYIFFPTQKKWNRTKIPTLDPSFCCRTDWSVMWREERICSHTGGEQKVKAEGRTGRRGGGGEDRERGVRREGGLLVPLQDEWGEKALHLTGNFIHFLPPPVWACERPAVTRPGAFRKSKRRYQPSNEKFVMKDDVVV